MVAATLLTTRRQESRPELSASILQAFLRTDQDISLRPWGRRCLADHHLRTRCPPNKPPRVSSGLGNPGSNPGGATRSSSQKGLRCAQPLPLDLLEEIAQQCIEPISVIYKQGVARVLEQFQS